MKRLLHKIWITFQGLIISLYPVMSFGAAILLYTRISEQKPWWAIYYFILATICLVGGIVLAYCVGTMLNEIIEEDKDD